MRKLTVSGVYPDGLLDVATAIASLREELEADHRTTAVVALNMLEQEADFADGDWAVLGPDDRLFKVESIYYTFRQVRITPAD